MSTASPAWWPSAFNDHAISSMEWLEWLELIRYLHFWLVDIYCPLIMSHNKLPAVGGIYFIIFLSSIQSCLNSGNPDLNTEIGYSIIHSLSLSHNPCSVQRRIARSSEIFPEIDRRFRARRLRLALLFKGLSITTIIFLKQQRASKFEFDNHVYYVRNIDLNLFSIIIKLRIDFLFSFLNNY